MVIPDMEVPVMVIPDMEILDMEVPAMVLITIPIGNVYNWEFKSLYNEP